MYQVETVYQRKKGRREPHAGAGPSTPTPNESLFSDEDGDDEEGRGSVPAQTGSAMSAIARPCETFLQQPESVVTRTVDREGDNCSNAESSAELSDNELDEVVATHQYPATPTSSNRIGDGESVSHIISNREKAAPASSRWVLGNPIIATHDMDG